MYKCGWNGCEKAYGTLNHLNAHVTMQGHGPKRTPDGKASFIVYPAFCLTPQLSKCGSIWGRLRVASTRPNLEANSHQNSRKSERSGSSGRRRRRLSGRPRRNANELPTPRPRRPRRPPSRHRPTPPEMARSPRRHTADPGRSSFPPSGTRQARILRPPGEPCRNSPCPNTPTARCTRAIPLLIPLTASRRKPCTASVSSRFPGAPCMRFAVTNIWMQRTARNLLATKGEGTLLRAGPARARPRALNDTGGAFLIFFLLVLPHGITGKGSERENHACIEESREREKNGRRLLLFFLKFLLGFFFVSEGEGGVLTVETIMHHDFLLFVFLLFSFSLFWSLGVGFCGSSWGSVWGVLCWVHWIGSGGGGPCAFFFSALF